MRDIEQAWYQATLDAVRGAFQMLELEDGMTVSIDWPNQTTKIRYQRGGSRCYALLNIIGRHSGIEVSVESTTEGGLMVPDKDGSLRPVMDGRERIYELCRMVTSAYKHIIDPNFKSQFESQRQKEPDA